MKIAINRRIVVGPYGGGNQILRMITEYFSSRNIIITNSLDYNIDAVFLFDFRRDHGTFDWVDVKKSGLNVPIIARINDNGQHRGDNRDLEVVDMSKEINPIFIFISNWAKNHFRNNCGILIENSHVIYNAVERDLFYANGHFRKSGEKLRIVTHHWFNNMAKGYNIYSHIASLCELDSRFSFRFLGNLPNSVLLKGGEVIPAQNYCDIPNFLNDRDVYLSASKFESGGSHVVEGMGCGLIPLVIFGGGGTEDYSKGYGFNFYNEHDLSDLLISLYSNYELYCEYKKRIDQYTYSSEDMCRLYYNVITKEVFNGCV